MRIRDRLDDIEDEQEQNQQDVRPKKMRTGSFGPAPVSSNSVLIVETANLPESNDDGAVTVPANSATDLLYWQGNRNAPLELHALGAADALDVEYRLMEGQDVIYRIQSPLGTVTSMQSFSDIYGGPIQISGDLAYQAVNHSDNDIELVARAALSQPSSNELL